MQICPNCKSTRIGHFRMDSDWGSGGDWYAENEPQKDAGYTLVDVEQFEQNARPDIECCVCCQCSTCFEPVSANQAIPDYATTERNEMTPEQRIDAALDSVLRASGSALKHYTMPSTLDAMRAAMRTAAEHLGNLKRVGWMTYGPDGNEVFFDNAGEAALYCDDDEEPIPIYMVDENDKY